MSTHGHIEDDTAPGDEEMDGTGVAEGISGYVVGLLLASALTIASFWVASTNLIYEPGIPAALITLAVAQMGVHLVFFLHITTAPDSNNNVLALAFGILIACLIIFGTVWIMDHLNHNLMPMEKMMQMQ